MKKVLFASLALFAVVLTFANYQVHQQASITDPFPTVATATQN